MIIRHEEKRGCSSMLQSSGKEKRKWMTAYQFYKHQLKIIANISHLGHLPCKKPSKINDDNEESKICAARGEQLSFPKVSKHIKGRGHNFNLALAEIKDIIG